ncbi:hypothetical protein ABFS83_14G222600 [Erythranthe nasuta]
MLLFLITCSFSFILFYTPLFACEMRLLSLCFWKSIKNTLFSATLSFFTSRMLPSKKIYAVPKVQRTAFDTNSGDQMSVLDYLPDLVLETILEKLPPKGLCRMACMSKSLRGMCVSDHLWERHVRSKWGRVVGTSAYREWLCSAHSRNQDSIFFDRIGEKGFLGCLIALVRSRFCSVGKDKIFPPVNSVMSWYIALESGKLWFPAQVYNRENGHVGFMLSCYDAVVSYDRRTDTFLARYPAHGTRTSAIESGVTWDRLRAPLVDTSPHDLHISDCLNELRPGDQIEIQWRRNKEFPYGWWYGVVGHLETCDGNANYCRCHHSESLVLEFNQYTRGCRWRTTIVNRRDHREEGNEADGFYGGIRKLCGNEEISMWKQFWPDVVLE